MDAQEHDDLLRPLPNSDEVTAKFDLLMNLFVEAHEKHTRPVRFGEGIQHRTYGACRHLRDQIMASDPRDVTALPAHIWSNTLCTTRLCLTCSREARAVERYTCGLCGFDNPFTDGHYRAKDRACAINAVWHFPLELHLPLCRRCEGIVSEYRRNDESAA